jgi:hypothetical protein
MRGAIFEDFQSFAHLPYRTDKFFSKDRWALTGEAGAFVDPFYSPGSDFIATANEFIGALIEADFGGSPKDFDERVDVYDAYDRFKYESTLLLYSRMYPIFGSYEVFRLKFLLDFNNYYNLVYWPFLADKLTDVAWIRGDLEFSSNVLRALTSMANHFTKMADVLRERGQYHAQNEGRWANGLNGIVALEPRITPKLDETFRRDTVNRVFGSVFAAMLERLSGQPGLGDRKRILDELHLPHVTVWKEIDEDSTRRFLDRVTRRLTTDVRRDFPNVQQVQLDLESSGVQLLGISVDDAEYGSALERAQALWNASGQSYAYMAL